MLQYQKMIEDKSIPEPNSGCWLWLGSVNNGYGVVGLHCVSFAAHRISFEAFKRKISPGKIVRHLCNNTYCVNPEHLAEGTRKDNSDDWIKAKKALNPLWKWYRHP